MEHDHRRGEQVHHTDDEGHHYCPTGFWYCVEWPDCRNWIWEEDVPDQCEKWG